MGKGIIRSDVFYCDHLGAYEADREDIAHFSVRDQEGKGLVEYIKQHAFNDETDGIMRTYLVRSLSTSELVGYFSLKAGLISINEVETEDGVVFDTVPGVELANYAVNYTYIQAHPGLKGVGTVIFDRFILPVVKDTAERVGVKIVYIFALPYERLIKRYAEYGFERLQKPYEDELHQRIKPYYDQGCIFMYQAI